jgi:general secretion pathway protein L
MVMLKTGADENEVRMSEILELSFQYFIKNLSLSIIDIQDKFQAPIGDVSLLGALSKVENLNAYITKTLGITCNTEDFMTEVFQPRQIQNISHLGDRAVIAVGLALEGLKRPRNPAVNLRQGEDAKQNAFWQKTWEKWGYTMSLVAVAFVCYTIYGYMREQAAVQLDETTYAALQNSAGAIAGIKGSQATPERIEEYINNEKDKAEKIKLFDKVQDIEPAMKVVNTLSAQFPSNKVQAYDIRKVDVKNSQVRIEGEAQQAATVENLRLQLQNMAAGRKVNKVQTTFGPAKGVPFAFTFNVKETL